MLTAAEGSSSLLRGGPHDGGGGGPRPALRLGAGIPGPGGQPARFVGDPPVAVPQGEGARLGLPLAGEHALLVPHHTGHPCGPGTHTHTHTHTHARQMGPHSLLTPQHRRRKLHTTNNKGRRKWK